MIFYYFIACFSLLKNIYRYDIVVYKHFLLFRFFLFRFLTFFNNSLQIGKTLLQIDVFSFTFFKVFLSNIDI